MIRSRTHDALPLLAAVLLATLGYGLVAPFIGWYSDDYSLVFGELNPWPTVREAFEMGGWGHLSAHRLLCYPLIGYVGGTLGPVATHLFQTAIHVLCVTLLFAVLRQLNWSAVPAAFAAALFAVAPWAAQPVVWWSAVPTSASTAAVLLAALAYIRWSDAGHRWDRWLAAYMAMVVISLLLYELWLCGFVLFWTLEFYRRRTRDARLPLHLTLFDALKRWQVLVPYAAWGVVFWFTRPVRIHQPNLIPSQIPRTLVSIHLRVYHWITDPPWASAIADGAAAWLSPIGLILLAAVLVCVTAIWMRRGGAEAAAANPTASYDAESDAPRREARLVDNLLLAWGVFLASRLVFIIQGGISTHTRHNYGAAMGFAIAVAAVLAWSWPRLRNDAARAALACVAGAVLIVLALTATGLGVHAGRTADAETATLHALIDELPQIAPEQTIVVAGSPVPTGGELSFYIDQAGVWLQQRLARHREGVRAYVVPVLEERGDAIVIDAQSRPDTSQIVLIPRQRAAVYTWRDGRLLRQD